MLRASPASNDKRPESNALRPFQFRLPPPSPPDVGIVPHQKACSLCGMSASSALSLVSEMLVAVAESNAPLRLMRPAWSPDHFTAKRLTGFEPATTRFRKPALFPLSYKRVCPARESNSACRIRSPAPESIEQGVCQLRESNSIQRVMTPHGYLSPTGEAGNEGFEPSTRGFGSRCSIH